MVIGKYYYVSEGTQVTHAKVLDRDGDGFLMYDLSGDYIGWFKAEELFTLETDAKLHLNFTNNIKDE